MHRVLDLYVQWNALGSRELSAVYSYRLKCINMHNYCGYLSPHYHAILPLTRQPFVNVHFLILAWCRTLCDTSKGDSHLFIRQIRGTTTLSSAIMCEYLNEHKRLELQLRLDNGSSLFLNAFLRNVNANQFHLAISWICNIWFSWFLSHNRIVITLISHSGSARVGRAHSRQYCAVGRLDVAPNYCDFKESSSHRNFNSSAFYSGANCVSRNECIP